MRLNNVKRDFLSFNLNLFFFLNLMKSIYDKTMKNKKSVNEKIDFKALLYLDFSGFNWIFICSVVLILTFVK